MHVITEVALDEDEQVVMGDYVHTYVDPLADQSPLPGRLRPSPQIQNLFTKAWTGKPLAQREWEALHYFACDVVHYAPEEMMGDKEFSYKLAVNVRGLMYECVRAIKRAEPGAIPISPGA